MSNLITSLATSLIRLLEFFLFARAIMSWFPQAQGSKLYDFLFQITEPLILPFRNLLSRFNALRMFPLDIAYLCAFFVLIALESLLNQL